MSSERLEIFQLNFQEKMYLTIILKITKRQSFTLSLEPAVSEKSQGGGQIDPLAFLGSKKYRLNPAFHAETILLIGCIYCQKKRNKHTTKFEYYSYGTTKIIYMLF